MKEKKASSSSLLNSPSSESASEAEGRCVVGVYLYRLHDAACSLCRCKIGKRGGA